MLKHDGYRSHITLKDLGMKQQGGAIASCFLAHSCGATQALDVYIDGSFKIVRMLK